MPSAEHMIVRLSGYCFWILMAAGGGWLAGAGCASCYNQQQLRQPAASSKRSAAAATPGKSGRARATERGKAATFGPTPASQLPAPCLCRPVRTFDLWALPGQSHATQPMIGLEKEEGAQCGGHSSRQRLDGREARHGLLASQAAARGQGRAGRVL